MIKISNLTLAYGDKVVYQDFSHTFQSNQTHVILGQSGCGKTSLLNAIADFVSHEGTIDCGKISYVFQQPRLAHTTVYKNVEIVLLNAIGDKSQRDKVVQNCLELAQIHQKAQEHVKNLSGGEKQRVSLARAFAYPSQTLLMDEPFKSLDLGIRKKLYATLCQMLQQNPRTTLLVTHDVEEALMLADQVYVLQNSPCALTHIATISTPHAQRDLYSEQMLCLRKQLQQLL